MRVNSPATWHSSASPVAWPSVSLTSLKRSRSMNISATFRSRLSAVASAWVTRSRSSTRLGSPVSGSWCARCCRRAWPSATARSAASSRSRSRSCWVWRSTAHTSTSTNSTRSGGRTCGGTPSPSAKKPAAADMTATIARGICRSSASHRRSWRGDSSRAGDQRDAPQPSSNANTENSKPVPSPGCRLPWRKARCQAIHTAP